MTAHRAPELGGGGVGEASDVPGVSGGLRLPCDIMPV